jgi:Ca2+-binding EF-hand superfamily protein
MKPSTLAALVAVALFGLTASAEAQTVKQTTTVKKTTDPITGTQTTTSTTMRTEFTKLDVNADGVIVLNELPSTEPFTKVWVTYDKDGDKRITRVEYDAYVTAGPAVAATTTTTTTTTTKPTFVMLDTNADGYVVVEEIPATSEFKKVWVSYDKDGDKRITRIEYEPFYTVKIDVDD